MGYTVYADTSTAAPCWIVSETFDFVPDIPARSWTVELHRGAYRVYRRPRSRSAMLDPKSVLYAQIVRSVQQFEGK